MIRAFIPEDSFLFDKTDPFGSIVHQYHADVVQNETYTCVRNGEAVGVLFFQKHFTWYSSTEHFHRLIPQIYALDDEARRELLRYATEWAKANRNRFEGKNLALANWIDTNSLAEITEYLRTGFSAYNITPKLQRDLGQLQHIPMPDGITVELLDTANDEAIAEYILLSDTANDGSPESENALRFITNEPSFQCFVARHQGKAIASVSTWRISEDVAAVENIFCAPAFRRKGITKGLMSHVMHYAKAQGYSFGELGYYGRNLRAQRLYAAMGFTLHNLQSELLYPAEETVTMYLP